MRTLEGLLDKMQIEKALSSFEGGGFVSVRQNPKKVSEPVFDGSLPVPWSDNGFFLESRPVFTLDPYFHAGAYYVQDSSSMYVGHVFGRVASMFSDGQPLKVLDLCAAPGGKSTDIASLMPSGSVLVSNEVMGQRVSVLKENVALWGNPDVFVTNNDPKDFGERLKGYFDVIVADVPCSGEGMFRKDPQALDQWSPDNVDLCASRQKRIIADVWPSLKPGGYLIYSTCTFNSKENSDNIKWMEETFGAVHILVSCPQADQAGAVTDNYGGKTFVWGIAPGEGQYCAVVRKPEDGTSGFKAPKANPLPKPVRHEISQALDDGAVLVQCGKDMLKAYSQEAFAQSAVIGSAMKVVHSGVAAGTIKGKDIVPDPDLALSEMMRKGYFPEYELGRDDALRFLARENIPQDPGLPRGYLLISFKGLPLGFVKNIGNRFNSLHPQGRRIRMNLNL